MAIVVTTDLSEPARRALAPARRLADALAQPLLLLHVVHAPVLAPAFTGSVDLDREDAERALTQLAAEIGGSVGTRVVEAEEVAPAIVREAERAGAELLVMASHGHGGLHRLRLGSVIEQVIHAARTPVVCVPATGPAAEGTKIVVATDLSDEAELAFPVARRLARALALPLTLLMVDDDPLAPRDLARLQPQATRLGGGDPVATEVVAAKEAAEGIAVQTRLDGAAMVCVAASPKSALRRLLLGSVSDEVVRRGSVPVVVIPG